MCYPVPYAISLAAAVRVGNFVGAGQASRARRAASAAQKIALSVVLGTACLLWILHKRVAAFYTDDSRVAQMFASNVSSVFGFCDSKLVLTARETASRPAHYARGRWPSERQ